MTTTQLRNLLAAEHSAHADIAKLEWMLERAKTHGFTALGRELQEDLKIVTAGLRNVQQRIAEAKEAVR